jgi:iron complex transport system ATP-binding protein
VLALIGPNGAGKSTLIRAASGVLAPVSGKIAAAGEDLARLKPRDRARRVAVVPQAARLPEAFTVEDAVLMGRTAYVGWLGRETDRDREIARSAMSRASIGELAERRIGEISGGEEELVFIARALAQSAPVLLLDEPTAHLDLRHQSRILGLVRELAREGPRAVLLALHDLNLAGQFAERVALLAGGGLRALGRPEEVLTPAIIGEAYGIRVSSFPHPTLGVPVIFPEVR